MRGEYKSAMGEVIEYLKYVPQEEKDRISPKFMEYLNENAIINENTQKDYSKPMYEIDFSPEAKNILMFIAYKYWAQSEEEKQKLMQILDANEEKYQEELKEKYNPDNMFKTEEKEPDEEELTTKDLITEEDAKKSRSIIYRITRFLRNLFKR